MSENVYDRGKVVIFASFEDGGVKQLVDYLADVVDIYDSVSWDMSDDDISMILDSIGDGIMSRSNFENGLAMDLEERWDIKTGIIIIDCVERVALYEEYEQYNVFNIPSILTNLEISDNNRISFEFTTSYYNGGTDIDEILSEELVDI